jgi:retinol dehydrogenase-12
MQVDLASLKTVKTFAEQFIALNKPLHMLINNAGIMACPKSYTEDGFETQFGVNHLGHFYLTKLLLPVLARSGTKESPARVVNLSSIGNYVFPPAEGIPFDDIQAEKSYDTFVRYGSSKLANIVFTKQLQKNAEAENLPVISVSVHPGVIIATNLSRHYSMSFVTSMLRGCILHPSAGRILISESMSPKTIPQGSATTVVAALLPTIKPGAHYADCQESLQIHPSGFKEDLQKRLWAESEQMIEKAMGSK